MIKYPLPAFQALLMALVLAAAPAHAQFTPVEVERAPSLDFLVAQLGAQAARPSTHLRLELPDIALPGQVRAKASSELPGTTTLVLARGRHNAPNTAPPPNLAPPPQLARKRGGEESPSPSSTPSVWIASAVFKAGETPTLTAGFEVEKTADYTLFAHAQGRWWFVTRQIKVGTLPATAGNQRPALPDRAQHLK